MDIVLVQGPGDLNVWREKHPDIDYREITFWDINYPASLRDKVQSDDGALIHRYDVAPVAWRTGSDALHRCLQILHDALAVESNPDGWKKTCPVS